MAGFFNIDSADNQGTRRFIHDYGRSDIYLYR